MDPTALTDTELDALTSACYAEQKRRQHLRDAPTLIEQARHLYAEASGRRDGDPYQPVSGAHDAYAPGSVVSDGDDYYRATGWASHPPGTTGAPWERVWPEGDDWTTTPPAETGTPNYPSYDPTMTYYPPAFVTHLGRTWELIHSVAAPGYEPGAAGMHAVWKDVGPA